MKRSQKRFFPNGAYYVSSDRYTGLSQLSKARPAGSRLVDRCPQLKSLLRG